MSKEQTIELDGLVLTLYRDRTGSLRIDITTDGLEPQDEHPGTGRVPKIRLSINDSMEHLDENGEWVPSTSGYNYTVLDYIAAQANLEDVL